MGMQSVDTLVCLSLGKYKLIMEIAGQNVCSEVVHQTARSPKEL